MRLATTIRDPVPASPPDPAIRSRRVTTVPAVIESVRRLTHDTLELVVKSSTIRPPVIFEAGQFATLKVAGIRRPRPYSFATSPLARSPREYTFFIRLLPGGEFSGWLAARNRTGEAIEVSGPLGKFGLDESVRPMICIAGGSGMSAIMSVLEDACVKNLQRDCYFLYGARTRADLYCDEAIEDIGRRWHTGNTFEFTQVLSEEPPDSAWPGPRGFVTDYFMQEYIARRALDVTRCVAFYCGPPPMVQAGIDVLYAAGMSAADIIFDRFEDARSPAPVIDNFRCVLCDECLLVKPLADCIVETAGLNIDSDNNLTSFERIRPGRTSGLYYNTLLIDTNECIRCYACVDACPHGAISPDFVMSKANTLRRREG